MATVQVGMELASLLAPCLVLGAVLVRALTSKEDGANSEDAVRGFEFWSSAFMAGFLVISWLAYPLSAGLGVPVSGWSSMLLGCGVGVPLWLYAWRRGRIRPVLPPAEKGDLWRWTGLALVGLVYQRNFSINQAVSSFCLKDNIRILLEPPPETGYLFRTIVGDQREGGPAFAAGAMGFFSDPLAGASIAFALCGMGVAAFTYTAVRRIYRREWVAVVTAYVAAFHPFLFRIPGLDENLITLAVTSFVVHLLLSGRQRLLPLVGFAGAYAFSVRHESFLFLPAVLWWVIRQHSLRPAASVLIAFATGIAPLIARHWLAMGSPFAYESFLQYQEPVPHEFLGYSWDVKTLLNYPFYPEIVRTPFNPFPTFLMHPLYLVRTSGYGLCVLSVVGFVGLLRSHRKTLGGFTALWVAPFSLVLSFLEHWDYLSKMSVPVVTLNAFFLWIAAGLEWAGGVFKHPGRLPGLLGATAFVVGGVVTLNSLPTRFFAPDPRYLARFPCARPERPDLIAMVRQWLSDVPVLPMSEWGEMARNVIAPPARGARWDWGGGGPWHTPNAVSWHRTGTTRPTTGAVVALLVDPTMDPAFPERVLRVVKESGLCTVTLGDRPVTLQASGVNVPWANVPARIEITYRPRESVLWVSVSTCEANHVEAFCASCDPPVMRESDMERKTRALESPRSDFVMMDPGRVGREGIVVCVPIPSLVVFIEMLNEWADRMLVTDGILDRAGFLPLGRTLPVSN